MQPLASPKIRLQGFKFFSVKSLLFFFFLSQSFNFNLLQANAIETKLRWERFEKYHDTLTEQEFRLLVDRVYSPNGALYAYLEITPDYVDIFNDATRNKPALFRLFFAKSPATQKKIKPYFKNMEDYRSKKDSGPKHPLRGLRILLDPGHIGGGFSVMEQRIFRVKDQPPITEAALNLKTALLLKKKLQSLGAKVYMTKSGLEPVTNARPENFYKEAEAALAQNGLLPSNGKQNERLIQKEAERLFYRTSEIEARAEYANRLRPDFTVCIHFNAAPGNGTDPTTEDNRLVNFIHGCYESQELDEEVQRYKLFSKLLEGSHDVELALTTAVTEKMAEDMALPHVDYPSDSPHYRRVSDNPYIYARNLAANRQFSGPVIYLEPYYQNNPVVYQRALAGDFEGEKIILGKSYRSIFREYADSVADGIVNFVREQKEQ